MDFDLDRSSKKFNSRVVESRLREQKNAAEKRDAEARHAQKMLEIEATLRARREEQAAREAEEEERRQEELKKTGGVYYKTDLRVLGVSQSGARVEENSDRMTLPPSVLQSLSQLDNVQYPMFFQLTAGESVAYAGVLEFVADENTCVLPRKVMKSLGVFERYSADPAAPLKVTVQYVTLPKGLVCRLRSTSADFYDVPDHKVMLEAALRARYTSLQKGDKIVVEHSMREYPLEILDIEPADVVSIIDTDLAIDIIGDEETFDTSSSDAIQPVHLNHSHHGNVNAGHSKFHKVTVDSVLARALGFSKVVLEVSLDVDQKKGKASMDADLYVSTGHILRPCILDSVLSAHAIGSKKLIISRETMDTDFSTLGGLLYVAVAAHTGDYITYRLKVSVVTLDGTPAPGGAGASVAVCDGEALCGNCNLPVPAANLAMHEAFCARNISRCDFKGCSFVFRGGEARTHCHCEVCGAAMATPEERDKHMAVLHTPIPCPCGAALHLEELRAHRVSDCPQRVIVCRYCGDLVAAGGVSQDHGDRLAGLTGHESVCGSRTTPCDHCGKNVRMKDMEMHILVCFSNISVGVGVPAYQPAPPVSFASATPLPAPIADAQQYPSGNTDSVMTDSFTGAPTESVSGALPPQPAPGAHFVECPICAQSLASERHLSHHFDEVHAM